MHRLVRKHGPIVVWAVGLRALGYPPTLSSNGKEVFLVTSALQG
jgi:hypothetical protein